MAHLEAANGPATGKQYQLEKDQIRLGRHPDCEVLIDSGGSVSRFHAEITNRDGTFFLKDSNSRNGTFVNGQMVQGTEQLFNEDLIQICDLVFEFCDTKTTSRPKTETSFPISVVDDQAQEAEASIMSRLEISATGQMVHVRASADAKLRAMIELTESLAQVLTVDAVLPPVLESIFKIFLQADDGVIVLKDTEGNWEPKFWQSRRESDEQVRVSRSIMNFVMDNREAILSRDTSDDSRFNMSESIANMRIRSFMCVPLIDTSGLVIGALQVDAIDSRDTFSDEELELLVAVASQAAIAIGRAQLHDKAVQVQKIQSELDLARRVQLQLLPTDDPNIDGFEFFSYYQAANKIGGDYYDYIQMPDGRLAALVADVSGHGVAAAMQMAKLSAEARFCLATTSKPNEVVKRINEILCADQIDGRFVTMIMLVLDPGTADLVIVNAGHSSPMLKKEDGSVDVLPNGHAGPLLGVVEGAEYAPAARQLQPGETITIFTDGLFEAMKADGSQYGEPRLAKQLESTNGSASDLGAAIIQDVDAFLGDGHQTDDICLLSISRSK